MPNDFHPYLKQAGSACRTEANTADCSTFQQRRGDPARSDLRASVRPEVIEVDFTSGEIRRLRLRPHSVPAKLARGLAIAWLGNALAAVVTLLWAWGTGDLAGSVAPNLGAMPFFLIGALTGLAADGSARLVALSPFRCGIRKAAFNNELLTGAAIVFLVISVVLASFGCLAVLIGLLL